MVNGPFEVFAYWDSKENQPQLTLTLIPRDINVVNCPTGVDILTKLQFFDA